MEDQEIIEKVHATVNAAWIMPDIEEQLQKAINLAREDELGKTRRDVYKDTSQKIFMELEKMRVWKYSDSNVKSMLEDALRGCLDITGKTEFPNLEMSDKEYLEFKRKYIKETD